MSWPEKVILMVGMQWDYCQPERGISGDIVYFYNNLVPLVGKIDHFWYDAYLEDLDNLQDALLEKADEVKPDLIFFVPYTNQFYIDTLKKLKKKFTTYAWFGDDHWRFDSYTRKYAPHYAFVSTTDPWSIYKYREIGISPILTEWAAQQITDNIGPLSDTETYEFEVSFVGGKNPVREWFIQRLQKQGIHVECFGTGWENGRISFEDMEQIFRKSKINLNLSNSVTLDIRFLLGGFKNLMSLVRSSKLAEQVKARHFEIPLAGGFQLSNYALGLERHWCIGEEIALYTSPEECTKQIKYYLENDQIRETIVKRSHFRAKKEHTYINRLKAVLEEIWK